MLRKRENPSPNWADKLMFEIYARFGLFIPFVAFVSSEYGLYKTAPHWGDPTLCLFFVF